MKTWPSAARASSSALSRRGSWAASRGRSGCGAASRTTRPSAAGDCPARAASALASAGIVAQVHGRGGGPWDHCRRERARRGAAARSVGLAWARGGQCSAGRASAAHRVSGDTRRACEDCCEVGAWSAAYGVFDYTIGHGRSGQAVGQAVGEVADGRAWRASRTSLRSTRTRWFTDSCSAATSGAGSPPTRRRRGDVPRSQVAEQALDHQAGEAARRRAGAGHAGLHPGRARRLSSLTDERARLAVHPVPDRLDEPVRGPAAQAVHPARHRRCCPTTRSSASTRCTSSADAPVPGLTHRYPDKALFLALDTCPVYCRFCTRSYAVGIDTDERREGQPQADEERWEQAFEYIASRPELEDIVISGGDAYNLRAEQITAIGDTPARHAATSAACASRPRARPCMPQKILTDDAWSRRCAGVVERGPQAAQGGRAAHALQPPQRDHRDHAASDEPAVRARHHGAQPVRAAARRQRQPGDHAPAGQAPGLHQRATVLRLRARPRAGRRGPAHHARHGARDREAGARLDGRLQHADLRGRRARRRRQARRALVRALRPGDGRQRVSQPERECGRVVPVLRPDRPAARGGRARWADPAQHEPMLKEAIAAARARVR